MLPGVDFRAASPFIDEDFNGEWQMFTPRPADAPRGIEFGKFQLGNMVVGDIILNATEGECILDPDAAARQSAITCIYRGSYTERQRTGYRCIHGRGTVQYDQVPERIQRIQPLYQRDQ